MKKFRSISSEPSSRSAKISGYTLLEMLVVLAILAAIAALTLPAMRGSLDKSRLRGASRQVQAALAKARFFSIREGTQVEFRYQLNGNGWIIQTVPSLHGTSQSGFPDSNENATPSGLSIEASPSDTSFTGGEIEEGEGDFLAQSNQPRILRQGELPATILFTEFLEEDEPDLLENSFELQPEDSLSDSNEIEVNAAGEQIIWSVPIRFLPNGRTEDATLRLSGPRDFFVNLKVRGLTGAISYSAPFRIRKEEEDSALDAEYETEIEEGIE